MIFLWIVIVHFALGFILYAVNPYKRDVPRSDNVRLAVGGIPMIIWFKIKEIIKK
jgi:hypothetical protein